MAFFRNRKAVLQRGQIMLCRAVDGMITVVDDVLLALGVVGDAELAYYTYCIALSGFLRLRSRSAPSPFDETGLFPLGSEVAVMETDHDRVRRSDASSRQSGLRAAGKRRAGIRSFIPLCSLSSPHHDSPQTDADPRREPVNYLSPWVKASGI